MTSPNRTPAPGEAATLLPCPFCEGHAITDCESDADYPTKKFMFARCTRCGVKTSAIYGSGDPSEWVDARYNWNRRATQPAQGVQAAGDAVARCRNCDDTGQVSSITGEWRGRGRCHCEAGRTAPPMFSRDELVDKTSNSQGNSVDKIAEMQGSPQPEYWEAQNKVSKAWTRVGLRGFDTMADSIASLKEHGFAVRALYLADPTVASRVAQPDGHLHDDGYFTWAPGKRPPFESHYAGWHVPFFLAAPTVADRDPLTMAQLNGEARKTYGASPTVAGVSFDAFIAGVRSAELKHGIGAEKTGAKG